jgi:DNA replication protein DnaC
LTDAFTQALLNAVPELTPEPGDYEQDGLLYCGKCHTPRQTRLEAPGTPLDGRTVIIPCRCRQALYDAETAQKKAYAQHEKVLAHNRQMIEAGIAEPIPPGTFADNDSDGKAAQVAQRYADGFEDHAYPGNHGLMLYGPPGTGKTFLAGCIANALTERDSHVLYTTIRKLTTAANRDFGADAELVQLEVQRCSLLILDDFGVERDTEFSWEQTERIINWRYEAGHPLLITTNLSPQEMQGGDITKQRVFDRVHDMCISIPVLGESRRKQHAAQKMQQARAWLLGG